MMARPTARLFAELPPQTRRLLGTVHDWVAGECARLALRRADFRFSRRQLRALTGWGDTQLKVHLTRLADLEYLLIHRMKVGQGYEYELLYDGEGEDGARFVMGLADPGDIYDAQRSGLEGERSPSGRGVVAMRSGGGRTAETAPTPQPALRSGDDDALDAETPLSRLNGAGASYPHPIAASA